MATTSERLWTNQLEPLMYETGEITMAITTLSAVKTYLGIGDTTYDDKINLLIPLVEADYLKIRNIPWDTDSEGVTVYPTGSDVTSAEMIGYKLATTGQNWTKDYGKTVVSESLDAHSISYGTGTGPGGNMKYGYPKDVISSIQTFIDGT